MTTTLERRAVKIAVLQAQEADLCARLETADLCEKRRIQALLVVVSRALHWQEARLTVTPKGKHGPVGRKTRQRRIRPASGKAPLEAVS